MVRRIIGFLVQPGAGTTLGRVYPGKRMAGSLRR